MNTRRKGDTMKAQRWLLLTAVILLLAGSAIAQNGSTRKVSANVPFDFIVHDTTLPKGEYVVSTDSDGLRLLIQNQKEPQYSTYLMSTDIQLAPGSLHSKDKLIFLRTNGQHVLHQISIEGDHHTHDIHHAMDVIELVAKR